MNSTLGLYRVGINFNPAASTEVDTVKLLAAYIIDRYFEYDGQPSEKADIRSRIQEYNLFLQSIGHKMPGSRIEARRCMQLAIQKGEQAYHEVGPCKDPSEALGAELIEESAMWAVKGITKPDLPDTDWAKKLQSLKK